MTRRATEWADDEAVLRRPRTLHASTLQGLVWGCGGAEQQM